MIQIAFVDSLKSFRVSVRLVFGLGLGMRLYVLYPGHTHDEREHITTTEKLLEVLSYIDSHGNDDDDDDEALQVLFVYPEDNSPGVLPVKSVPVSPVPAIAPAAEEKSETSSQKSSRSTYQKQFATEVKQRDGKCGICDTVSALEGCHIVDVQAKLSEFELRELGLVHKYEIWNGITLCATCHYNYDHWKHGIDEDGYVWTKEQGQWTLQTSRNIYPDPSSKTVRRYPDPGLLRWKFRRFEVNRDKITTRLANVLSSIFLTPTKNK